jgi:ribosome-binding protein aMBF1 (putative translation factor)
VLFKKKLKYIIISNFIIIQYKELMSHQDWETVTFSSKKTNKSSQTTDSTPKKPLANIQALKIENKVDNTDEKLSVKKIDPSAVRAIIKSRGELGLTQKDLANKVNISDAVIKSIEQNKEPHNTALLNKLQKALKVKLLGDNIGTPL